MEDTGALLFEKANALHIEGKFEEAEREYDALLTQNHDHIGLLASMGTLFLSMHKYGLAMSLLHRALEKSKDRPSEVVANLAIAYRYSGQHEKAMKLLEEACRNNPSPETLTTYGAMFVESDEQDKAVRVIERALSMNPQLALAHWNLAIFLLTAGQWERAWDEYEWGFKCKMRIERHPQIPFWKGEPGTVLVYGEQGIGDEIMFASMIPDLMKTNKVIFECHTRLKTLFEKSFGIECHGTREDADVTYQADYKLSIGSLGKFFRRTRESFPGTPYLKSESAPKGKKFRVGISWTGGLKAGRVRTRTVPLSWWKSILNNDCEFISLQYTDCADEIKLLEDQGYEIKQFPEIKAQDYYETAKLVKSCDLVISVATSVIHLAGALGVPTWVMTPKNPAWRYQNKGPIPWYRSVRLYRKPESWIPVVQQIGLDLSDLRKELAA